MSENKETKECENDFNKVVEIIDHLIDPPHHFKIGKSSSANTEDVKARYVPHPYKNWKRVIDTKYADSVEEALILHYRRLQKASCDNEQVGGGEPGATYIYLAYNTLTDKVQEHLDNLSGQG